MSDALSQIEIIASGRWENALFTTFCQRTPENGKKRADIVGLKGSACVPGIQTDLNCSLGSTPKASQVGFSGLNSMGFEPYNS
jgi:hypothetical protein